MQAEFEAQEEELFGSTPLFPSISPDAFASYLSQWQNVSRSYFVWIADSLFELRQDSVGQRRSVQ